MKFDFKNASLAEKVILGSACLAIISLFMPWVSAFGFSQNGFQQQGYIMLVLFAYPVVTILTGKIMNKPAGFVCGVVGTLFMIYYINSKRASFFGTTVSGAGAGLYICTAALVALAVGSYMYQKSNN